ncbi:unnamed protein product [Lupinus luteus]|uniref:Uncharacterized protein n=1 Tax=Lupinus luteus TaxID=3873 RepID=A0AAV1WAY1_LUPLU
MSRTFLSNIWPSLHVSDIPLPKAKLISSIYDEDSNDIAAIISDAIWDCINKGIPSLILPSFITALCKFQNVSGPYKEMMALKLEINVAYVNAYCEEKTLSQAQYELRKKHAWHQTRPDTVRTQAWHGQTQAWHTPSCSPRQLSGGPYALGGGPNTCPGQQAQGHIRVNTVKAAQADCLAELPDRPTVCTQSTNLPVKQHIMSFMTSHQVAHHRLFRVADHSFGESSLSW